MPSCPGCKRDVPHTHLPGHVQTCKWIWSERPARENHHTEHLAVQVARLEAQVFGQEDPDSGE